MAQKAANRESENPYQASSLAADATAPRADDATAREVFLAWEKLRLYFNLILLVETLLLGLLAMGLLWPHLPECLFGALVANACFCLGPVLEGYAEWIGIERGVTRWVIFIVGTLVAMALTFVSVGVLVDK